MCVHCRLRNQHHDANTKQLQHTCSCIKTKHRKPQIFQCYKNHIYQCFVISVCYVLLFMFVVRSQLKLCISIQMLRFFSKHFMLIRGLKAIRPHPETYQTDRSQGQRCIPKPSNNAQDQKTNGTIVPTEKRWRCICSRCLFMSFFRSPKYLSITCFSEIMCSCGAENNIASTQSLLRFLK